MVAMSMKDFVIHTDGWCRTANEVKAPDCAAPTKFAHAANDNGAGYLFNVNPCKGSHHISNAFFAW